MHRAFQRKHFLLCCVLIAAYFAILFSGTRNPLSIDDGLRHIVMAQHYRNQGIGNVDGWGVYFFSGYFAERSFDPWFLADLSYIPFTFLPDLVLGLKAHAFVSLCILFLSFISFFRLYRPPPILACLCLLLFFFGSYAFSSRLYITRPFILVTALFLLTYYFILRQRYGLLMLLLIVATLFSHLFIFPLALCFLATGWYILRREWRHAVGCFLSSTVGVVIGVLLHPHSSEYLSWMKNIFFIIPFSKQLHLGAEVSSGFGAGDVGVFLLLAVIFLLFFLLWMRGEWREAIERRPEMLLSTALVFVLFLAFSLWARAIDFLWPVILLLLLQLVTSTPGIERDVLQRLRVRLHPSVGITLLSTIFILCFVVATEQVIGVLQNNSRNNLRVFAAIENIPSGSRVLNVDWDLFPVLLFLNSEVLYGRGIDPTLDYEEDPLVLALYSRLMEREDVTVLHPDLSLLESLRTLRERWQQSASGSLPDFDASQWIHSVRRHFDADYLVLHRGRYVRVIEELRRLPDLPLFAESEAITIFTL